MNSKFYSFNVEGIEEKLRCLITNQNPNDQTVAILLFNEHRTLEKIGHGVIDGTINEKILGEIIEKTVIEGTLEEFVGEIKVHDPKPTKENGYGTGIYLG